MSGKTTEWLIEALRRESMPYMHEAADRLSTLSSEVERMRGALREIRTIDRRWTEAGEACDGSVYGQRAAKALQEEWAPSHPRRPLKGPKERSAIAIAYDLVSKELKEFEDALSKDTPNAK